MVYTNTDYEIKRREGMGNWMKNYPLTENGKGWDYCVGLSYRRYELKTSNGRRNIKLLFKKLYELDNSVNGFVVETQSSEALHDGMELCIKNLKSMKEYGQNSAEMVKKKYSLELIAQDYLELIKL